MHRLIDTEGNTRQAWVQGMKSIRIINSYTTGSWRKTYTYYVKNNDEIQQLLEGVKHKDKKKTLPKQGKEISEGQHFYCLIKLRIR